MKRVLQLERMCLFVAVGLVIVGMPLSASAEGMDGLSATANWTNDGGSGWVSYGYSASTAGDVNGDGYSDVVVGAYEYSNGQNKEGRVFLYLGGASGLSTSANWIVESDQAFANMGWSVGTAGDVNGDGYADVIVGAPQYITNGGAFVFYGSPTGLSTGNQWTAVSGGAGGWFGSSVGAAGDINGDGYDDVIVGAPQYGNGEYWEGRAFVYYGSSTGLSGTANWTWESNQERSFVGGAVGAAGDVNGDGYSDVIVGAWGYDNGESDEGKAFVFHGSPTGLSTTANWMAEPNNPTSYFGWSVSAAGDVNGDGYADVIVGANYDENGAQPNEGRSYIYYGGPDGLSTTAAWTGESNQSYAHYGRSVGVAGDVNGDGYSDVIVGAEAFANPNQTEGKAFVYYGRTNGPSTTADWSVEGNQTSAELGVSVNTAGDVNGDGYADVIVGAPRFNVTNYEGRVYVFHGGPRGLSSNSLWTAQGDQIEGYLGTVTVTAGDINGDGYDDTLVSAYSYDNGNTDEGKVLLFYGGSTGLSTTAAWTMEGNQDWANLGRCMSAAGDVNGDGYADVIVGAPGYSRGQTREGVVFAYYGSSSGLSTAANWTAESDQGSANFGIAAGGAGDVNGDGYGDVIVGAPGYDRSQSEDGAVFVYHGGSNGLSTAAVWTVSSDQAWSQFGFSAGAAGDVNGDGYDDVIAGAYDYSSKGAAFVYLGGADGLSTSAHWKVVGNQTSARFGWSLGFAGDVNDDGCSDVIIAADRFDNEGRVFVYYGAPAGLSTTASWTAEGNQTNGWFGFSVGTAGDVNGDGYADVVVGAPYFTSGQTNEGRIFIYLGGSTGLADTAVWTAESDQAGAELGFWVGGAGDVNGDGYGDVIAGAPLFDNTLNEDGKAFLYSGSAQYGAPVRASQWRADGSARLAPGTLSDAVNGFQLRLNARTPLGRGKVKLAWQATPVGKSFSDSLAVSGVSSQWCDTGTSGCVITNQVDGIGRVGAYRWRARVDYEPGSRLGQPHSRWFYGASSILTERSVMIGGSDLSILQFGKTTNFVVSWRTLAGASYHLSEADNLINPAWQNISGTITAQTTTALIEVPIQTATSRFYKVALEAVPRRN